MDYSVGLWSLHLAQELSEVSLVLLFFANSSGTSDILGLLMVESFFPQVIAPIIPILSFKIPGLTLAPVLEILWIIFLV